VDATLADPLVGRLLDDRYLVVSRIDRGGMATVYHAVDRRLDRDVALKVLHAHLAGDQGFAARFVREARSAARLSHPNVVGVFDQGQDGDLLFLAMEYLPGRTLRHVLVERGALTPKEALRVMDPVLDALAAAHRAGIVHRDIKPENVILTDDGRVKVADFGLARAATSTTATTGVLLGTVAYLAPELVARGVADERSDVYAAGVMLFEMLTGRQPFVGEIPAQVAYRHVHEDVPAPSSVAPTVPEALDDVVLAATGREPDERPDDAAALLAMVRAARRRIPPEAMNLRAAVPLAAGAEGLDPFDGIAATQAVARAVDNRTRALPGIEAGGTGTTAAAHGAPPGPRSRRHALVPQPLPVNEPDPTAPLDDGALARLATRRRRRGFLVMALVIVTAVALVVGAYWFIAGPGARTVVPATVTLTQAEATQRLEKAELGVRVRPEYSDKVKKGVVMSSDPAVGESVRKGGKVTLVVSRGPQLFGVPDVTGNSRADAEQELRDNGFRVGRVEQEYSSDVAKGDVVSTSPKEGTQRPRNSTVDLVVSKGEEPVSVPDVRGQTQDQAEKLLGDAGFDVTVSDQQAADPTVPAGSVAGQQPAAGEKVESGSTVTIVLSKGADVVQVPDVRREKKDKAVEELQKAGFQVNVVQQGEFFDRVSQQNPEPGTPLPPGSVVTIVVF